MSDFLSNLVARSLNNAKVIRPRLTSLFEPQNPMFIRTSTGNFELDRFIEQVPEEAAPRKRPDASSEMPDIETKLSRWNLRQAPRHTDEMSPEEAVQNVLRPHREVKASEPESEESSINHQGRSNHQQSASARTAETEIFSPRSEFRKPEFAPDFEKGMPERNAGFDEVRQHLKIVGSLPEIGRQKAIEFAAFRRGSEPISSRVFRGQQQPVQSVVRADRSEMVNTNAHPMYPHGTHYSEPAALRQIKPMNTPEPAIEVTIGRIEVRATPSASQPKMQSQKSPKMSLDEYLHQRSGGGIK
jgi:hypothetical protein